MDFGLGLVLSFTDNASAGMNSAVQSLNNLTSVAESASNSMSGLNSTASLIATSTSANMLGDSFIKAGTGMLGMFNTLISKTQQLGSEYENFGVTLGALGMNAEESISKLFKFANKSPLEVGDIKDMIVTLQAQGINAFDETTGAISGTRQEFLAFLTDLKSFKPEVAGMRFNMAIQNYIGSGEKKQMRTVFDMGDIEDIIGHAVSNTAEGRMQDIVEMVEKKGLTGLSASLANTWSGVASNVSDAFTRIFYSVANDGGVFEKLKQSFIDLAQVIIDLPEEDLANLGRTIGDALNIIVTPLTKIVGVVKNVITSMIELAQTRPALLKWGIVLTTVAGIVTVLTGVVFKIVGAFANFTLVMQSLGLTITKVATMFKSGFATMASSILPLVAVMGLLALAWKTDFGGIRAMTTNFINNLVNSWQTARNAVDGSVQGLRNTLNNLRSKDDFWSNITIGFMQIYGTFKFLAEAWNSYELSNESLQKAQELGILPLITSILMLKWRFEQFAKGFKRGWGEVSDYVQGVLTKLAPKLKGTIFQGMIDKATEFFQLFTGGDGKDWENFGNSFAHFTAKALAFGIAFKAITSVVSNFLSVFKVLGTIFSPILKIFSRLGGLIGKLVAPISTLISSISTLASGGLLKATSVLARLANTFALVSGGAGSFTEALAVMFPGLESIISFIEGIGTALAGIGAGPILAIIAIISSIVAFAMTQKEKFLSMMTSIKDTFFDLVNGVVSRAKEWGTTIYEHTSSWIGAIKGALSNLKGAFDSFTNSGFFKVVVSFLSIVGESLMNTLVPAFNLVLTIIKGVFQAVIDVVGGVITFIVDRIGGWISGTINIIAGIIKLFTDPLEGLKMIGEGRLDIVVGTFSGLLGLVGGILQGIWDIVVSVFGGLVTYIVSVSTNFMDTFSRVFGGILDFFGNVFNSIKQIFVGAFNTIKNTVVNILTSIKTFIVSVFTSYWNFIFGILNKIKTFIVSVFTSYWSFIFEILNKIKSGVRNALNTVKGIFSKVFGGIKTFVVSVFTNYWNTISNVINRIVIGVKTGLGKVKSTFTTVFDKIKTTVSNVFNGIKSTISNVMGTIKDTISGALDTIKSVFSKCKLSLPKIKVPHFDISSGKAPWGLGGKGTAPKIDLKWYARGGVFDSPSIIGVGENGKEAVMPLENNLGWIDSLASMISSRISGSNNSSTPQPVTPMSTSNNVTNNNITRSVTNNATSSVTNNAGGSTDNSVHFEAGSIVIQASEFSNAEAEKFAKMIMEKIKRQNEINSMLKYQTV